MSDKIREQIAMSRHKSTLMDGTERGAIELFVRNADTMQSLLDENERLKESQAADWEAYKTSKDNCNTRIALLEEVVEAARLFSIHTPAWHIPGLMQKTKYEQLQESIVKLEKSDE